MDYGKAMRYRCLSVQTPSVPAGRKYFGSAVYVRDSVFCSCGQELGGWPVETSCRDWSVASTGHRKDQEDESATDTYLLCAL